MAINLSIERGQSNALQIESPLPDLKDGVLYLHWVVVNLERRGNYPTLTPNEQQFRKAILSGNLVNHYHHTWVDGEGEQRWGR